MKDYSANQTHNAKDYCYTFPHFKKTIGVINILFVTINVTNWQIMTLGPSTFKAEILDRLGLVCCTPVIRANLGRILQEEGVKDTVGILDFERQL